VCLDELASPRFLSQTLEPMEAKQNALQKLHAQSPRPAEGAALQAAVRAMLDTTPASSSAELTKGTWEHVLRAEILDFTVRAPNAARWGVRGLMRCTS
jgi:hypothetical protein